MIPVNACARAGGTYPAVLSWEADGTIHTLWRRCLAGGFEKNKSRNRSTAARRNPRRQLMNDASTSARAGAAGQVRREWEWFWRFLAVVMLLSACWVGWIAVQLSAPGIVLPEAFAAAAQARANQNVSGRIGEAPRRPGRVRARRGAGRRGSARLGGSRGSGRARGHGRWHEFGAHRRRARAPGQRRQAAAVRQHRDADPRQAPARGPARRAGSRRRAVGAPRGMRSVP
jgi:hypothetical protein